MRFPFLHPTLMGSSLPAVCWSACISPGSPCGCSGHHGQTHTLEMFLSLESDSRGSRPACWILQKIFTFSPCWRLPGQPDRASPVQVGPVCGQLWSPSWCPPASFRNLPLGDIGPSSGRGSNWPRILRLGTIPSAWNMDLFINMKMDALAKPYLSVHKIKFYLSILISENIFIPQPLLSKHLVQYKILSHLLLMTSLWHLSPCRPDC